jgi:predicted transcriptional regulator
MTKISVGVRLSPVLHEKLMKHAEKCLQTKSEIIAAALAEYLGCTEEMPLTQRLAEVETKILQLQQQFNQLST